MQRYTFSELDLKRLREIVNFKEADFADWQPDLLPLSDEEKLIIDFLKKRLQTESIVSFNEATIWGKAIYPLLLMAEKRPFVAWAQIGLQAEFAEFWLEGIADGVIGTAKIGHLASPFLVVIEAKRGENAPNPRYQLFGSMLAAAKLNWEETPSEPQTIFGCYTISDAWVFVRGEIRSINEAKPSFFVTASREYIERVEAEAILGILKAIVAKYGQ